MNFQIYKNSRLCFTKELTIKLTCTYSSVSKCFTFYHLNLQIVMEINWKNFFFSFRIFFLKLCSEFFFLGRILQYSNECGQELILILSCFFLFFLDSEPESEDSYYGTPRNNNNKRRKSRGILKTTPSEYVLTSACTVYIHVFKKFSHIELIIHDYYLLHYCSYLMLYFSILLMIVIKYF